MRAPVQPRVVMQLSTSAAGTETVYTYDVFPSGTHPQPCRSGRSSSELPRDIDVSDWSLGAGVQFAIGRN